MQQMLTLCGLLLLGLGGSACTHMDAGPVSDPAPVNAAIEDVVARGAFPFLYVRVETLDGDVVYEHSAINQAFTDRPPTGADWMRIWSMTKSVTIATILDLEEDGVLHRSDAVTTYIPEFADLMV